MEALYVVLGAVLGFAGSIAGSIYVNRRELTRRMRIDLFMVDLPRFQETILRSFTADTKTMDELRDAGFTVFTKAGLAGSSDRSNFTPVLMHTVDATANLHIEVDESGSCRWSNPETAGSTLEALYNEVVSFAEWVEKKIR